MSNSDPLSPGRRNFLASTGGVIAGAVAAPSALAAAAPQSEGSPTHAAGSRRKIPIGVFDPAFPDLTLDQLVEQYQSMGVEAAEIGTGGYPNNHHCPLDELLADSGKLRAWQKKFADHNIQVAVLSCHGNPVHPDKAVAQRDWELFQKTVQLAERTGVKVIVGFSGCPGGNPNDTNPNWITYRWPPEYNAALD